MKYLFFILLLMKPFLVFSDEIETPQEQKLATEYIQTLTSNDMVKLSSFYNRESIFQDQTANKKYTGRKNILAFFKRAHLGLLEYKFTVEHMFNAGSLVVMVGSYNYKGLGHQFGKPGKVINIAVSGVTTLEVDVANHRIKKHIDLIDYQTMNNQLDIQ